MILRRSKSITVVICLLIFWIALMSSESRAQSPSCVYDRNTPSVENARLTFQILKFKCAELELIDVLQASSLSPENKCQANFLLAAVYYAMIKDETDKRDKVLEQFRAAFNTDRDWQGELDIKSDKFTALMEEARKQVSESGKENMAMIEPIYKPVEGPSPSSMTPLIGTGLFIGSAVFFLSSSGNASDKWDKYNDDPSKSEDLYSSYNSANNTKKVAGVLTIVSGVVTGYLWWKYFGDKKKSREKAYGQAENDHLQLSANLNGIRLTYYF